MGLVEKGVWQQDNRANGGRTWMDPWGRPVPVGGIQPGSYYDPVSKRVVSGGEAGGEMSGPLSALRTAAGLSPGHALDAYGNPLAVANPSGGATGPPMPGVNEAALMDRINTGDYTFQIPGEQNWDTSAYDVGQQRIAQNTKDAMRALANRMTARGIGGSGIEAEQSGKILQEGQRGTAGLAANLAQQKSTLSSQFAAQHNAGALQARGQDIGLAQSLMALRRASAQR